MKNARIPFDGPPEVAPFAANLHDDLVEVPATGYFAPDSSFLGLGGLNGERPVMRAAYGQCSELLHHAGDAMNPSIPTPDQIEDELKPLTAWLEDIARRQRAVA